MQRPATSKARGQCRYFSVPGGCLNGDSCKFLHGEGETLTPYDKSKRCKFFTAGFCRRGEKCWFLHDKPLSTPKESEPSGSNTESQSDERDVEQEPCAICLDRPVTYGLLSGCSHIFCLDCIRNWRTRQGKAEDVVESGNIKKCPYCRSHSPFVTPSSTFFPDGDSRKTLIIEQYKASMARVPCKYFTASSPVNRRCPYGRDCFYQHKNSDGSDYVFPHGVDFYLPRFQSRHSGSFASTALDTLRRLLPMIPIIESGFRPHGSEVDDAQGSNRLSTLLSNLVEFTRTYGELPDVMNTDHETMEDYVARLVFFLSSRMSTVFPESNIPGRLAGSRERSSGATSMEVNRPPTPYADHVDLDTNSSTTGDSEDREVEDVLSWSRPPPSIRTFVNVDLENFEMPELRDSDDDSEESEDEDDSVDGEESGSRSGSPSFGSLYDPFMDMEFASLADRLVRFNPQVDEESESGEEEHRNDQLETDQRTVSSLSSYPSSTSSGLSGSMEPSTRSDLPSLGIPQISFSPSDSESQPQLPPSNSPLPNSDLPLSSTPTSTIRSDEIDEDNNTSTLSPPRSSAALFKELRRSRSDLHSSRSRSGSDVGLNASTTTTMGAQGFITDGRGRVICAPE